MSKEDAWQLKSALIVGGIILSMLCVMAIVCSYPNQFLNVRCTSTLNLMGDCSRVSQQTAESVDATTNAIQQHRDDELNAQLTATAAAPIYDNGDIQVYKIEVDYEEYVYVCKQHGKVIPCSQRR